MSEKCTRQIMLLVTSIVLFGAPNWPASAQFATTLEPITAQNANQVTQQGEPLTQGAVNQVLWSQDGEKLVVDTALGTWVYDADDLQTTPRFLDNVSNVRLSRDGTTLISTSFDGVRLWDVQDGQELMDWDIIEQPIYQTAFSPDLTLVAFINFDNPPEEENTITIWNLGENTLFRQFPFDQFTNVGPLAFGPDGELLAAYINVIGPNAPPSVVRLWDVETGEIIRDLEIADQSLTPYHLVFSPDGDVLATEGGVWDVPTGDRKSPNITRSSDLVFSHDGSVLANVGVDFTTFLFEVESGEVRSQIPFEHWATAAAFSPDDKFLAVVQDRSLQLWDVETLTQILAVGEFPGGNVNDIQFTPDGSRLFVHENSSGSLHIWDVARHEHLSEYYGIHFLMAFRPDLTMGAFQSRTDVALLDTETGVTRQIPLSLCSFTERPAFSADGRFLAIFICDSSGKSELIEWDVERRVQRDFLLLDDYQSSRTLAFAAGDTVVVAEIPGQGVVFWHLERQTHWTIPGYDPVLNSEATKVATIDNGGQLTVWNTSTNEALYQHLEDNPNTGIGSHVFDPSGTGIAFAASTSAPDRRSSETRVRFWDIRNNRLVTLDEVFNYQFLQLAFSLRGDILVVGGQLDGVVSLWDPQTGEKLAELSGHHSPVYRIAFSPDGAMLATASSFGDIRLWGIPAA